MQNKSPEEEQLPSGIRAAFDAYPRPIGNDQFDAKFWRELDNRRNRYRGVAGVARRLIEVEIEGIAVWRLGAALFGVPTICVLGFAVLSLGNALLAPAPDAQQIAETRTVMPRYAREWLDEDNLQSLAPVQQPEKPKAKEEISCVSFARDLA